MKFVNFKLVSAAMALSENAELFSKEDEGVKVLSVEATSCEDFSRTYRQIQENQPVFWKNIINDSLMYAQCKRLAFNDNEIESILNDPRRPRFIE
ncbi:MAG TPA: hypothetical protein V6C96_02005 [Vampirovibrionales bacterium]